MTLALRERNETKNKFVKIILVLIDDQFGYKVTPRFFLWAHRAHLLGPRPSGARKIGEEEEIRDEE